MWSRSRDGCGIDLGTFTMNTVRCEREREAHAHDSCIIMYHLNSCMSPDSPCCCREHYHTDQVIPKELIAFSDPSPSGRKFAESYVGMQHFLVYQWFS